MSSSGASSSGAKGALTDLQAGVLVSGDLAISAISINTGTGALTFTLAAASQFLYVVNASGVLTAVAFAGGASTPAATTPATPNYAVVGIEIDTSGNVTAIKGTDTATQLNTGTLIASNSPATSSGKVRVFDFAIQNNAGAFRFGDQTTVATKGVNWIDRRPWARGSYTKIVRNANAAAGNDYTTVSTTNVAVDATNVAARMECTGVPVRATLRGRAFNTTTQIFTGFSMYMDGAGPDGASTTQQIYGMYAPVASGEAPLDLSWDFLPAAGSHLFIPQYSVSSGTGTIFARATIPLIFTVEELVRQNVANGAA